jgi:hypothetical protein
MFTYGCNVELTLVVEMSHLAPSVALRKASVYQVKWISQLEMATILTNIRLHYSTVDGSVAYSRTPAECFPEVANQ